MASQGDISGLVAELKAGKRDAARPLWDAYYRRLMGFSISYGFCLLLRCLSPFPGRPRLASGWFSGKRML
jgi:hypothetical protein